MFAAPIGGGGVGFVGQRQRDFFGSHVHALIALLDQRSDLALEVLRLKVQQAIAPGDAGLFQPVPVDRWRLAVTDRMADNGR